jgi:hypothetical protein
VELAVAALSRVAVAGGAAACSAELGGEALGADLGLLCRALSAGIAVSAAGASSAAALPDASRCAALSALAAALDEVLERRCSSLPSASAPPLAAALAAALRAASALQAADAAAEAPTAALRALGALLQARRALFRRFLRSFRVVFALTLTLLSTQEHGQAVPPAEAPALAAALLPWAVPDAPDVPSRAPSPAPTQAAGESGALAVPRRSRSAAAGARREPSRLALTALGALCSRLGPVLPPAQAGAALAAAAAALSAVAGPPAAAPAAPLPARPPAEDVATARYCAAALRCAHLCAPVAPPASSGGPASPAAAQPAVPPPLAAALLGQARRFMLFGLPRPGAPRLSAAGGAHPWDIASDDDAATSGDESGNESDSGSVASSRSLRTGGAGGGEDRCARVRAAACLLVASLARAAPRTAHPHWPALLCPRGGGPASARAALPAVLTHDPAPRVRAAAAAALAALLDGPPARAYLAVADCRAGARSAAAAASLSAQLADGAAAAHAALVGALDSEDTLPTLVAACRAAAAFALAAPFGRLPPPLAPALAAAAWRRAESLQGSMLPDASAARLALVSTLAAAMATRSPAPALAAAMLGSGGDGLRLAADDATVLRSLLRDVAALAGSPAAAMPLRLEAWAALRGAGRGYPAALASAWGDDSDDTARSGLASALEACAPAADDKLAAAAMRCLADALRAAGGGSGDGEDGAEAPDTSSGTPQVVPPAVDAHILAAMWARAASKALPAAMAHAAPAVRAAAVGAVAGLTCAAAERLQPAAAAALRQAPLQAMQRDTAPAVRAAAARALGSLVGALPAKADDAALGSWLVAASAALRAGCADASAAVALASACGAANAAAAARAAAESGASQPLPPSERAALAAAACAVAATGADKARPHAARCLGHLAAADATSSSQSSAPLLPDWLPAAAAALRGCLAASAGAKAQLSAAVACEPLLRVADVAQAGPPGWASDTLTALCACVSPVQPAKLALHAAAALGAVTSRRCFGDAWGACVAALLDSLSALDAPQDDAPPEADARLRPALRAALTAAMLRALALGASRFSRGHMRRSDPFSDFNRGCGVGWAGVGAAASWRARRVAGSSAAFRWRCGARVRCRPAALLRCNGTARRPLWHRRTPPTLYRRGFRLRHRRRRVASGSAPQLRGRGRSASPGAVCDCSAFSV